MSTILNMFLNSITVHNRTIIKQSLNKKTIVKQCKKAKIVKQCKRQKWASWWSRDVSKEFLVLLPRIQIHVRVLSAGNGNFYFPVKLSTISQNKSIQRTRIVACIRIPRKRTSLTNVFFIDWNQIIHINLRLSIYIYFYSIYSDISIKWNC